MIAPAPRAADERGAVDTAAAPPNPAIALWNQAIVSRIRGS